MKGGEGPSNTTAVILNIQCDNGATCFDSTESKHVAPLSHYTFNITTVGFIACIALQLYQQWSNDSQCNVKFFHSTLRCRRAINFILRQLLECMQTTLHFSVVNL